MFSQSVGEDVLARLESTEPANMPVLVRFLLHTAPREPAAVRNLVKNLRITLKFSPASESELSQDAHGYGYGGGGGGGRGGAESGAALTLEALRNGLRLRPDVANEYLKELSHANGTAAHYAVDLWYAT